jgi:hypothetical protein
MRDAHVYALMLRRSRSIGTLARAMLVFTAVQFGFASGARAQTFVQVADLDPRNSVGPRTGISAPA